jgi:thioredoxin-dependent peroxiredoxin
MIDPSKATKGRRMSKKTRKKSPKAASRKTARAAPAKSAKAPRWQTGPAKAGKPGKKATKKPAAATSRPTKQKGRSSQTKPAASRRPTRAEAAPAAKPETVEAAMRKPSTGPTQVPSVAKAALSEGAKAPEFRLPRDGGGIVSLSDYSGRKLVLFFYPRADTPGCTREAIDFTRLANAFDETKTAVLGISADPPKAQEAFRDKHQLVTPLVSDEQHKMLQAYGVWGEKSMYGKTFHGVLRTTFLIGANGRILKIWRNVKVDGHADEVLAAVRAL